MRVAAVLLSVSLLLPGSLSAQTTCAEFLSQPESVRIHYATGLLMGFSVAAGQVGALANAFESDTIGVGNVAAVAQDLDADINFDSLRNAVMEQWQARGQGVKDAAEFLRDQLTESRSSTTTKEIAFRMAAECSRSDNEQTNFSVIFLSVLQDLQP